MAAITSLASGAWNATGTWTGGVIPVAGDTVTINHTVTVTSNVTGAQAVGLSKPTSPNFRPIGTAVTGTPGLAAGAYIVVVSYYDSVTGTESTYTTASTAQTITGTQILRVSFGDTLPSNLTRRVYITDAGGANGTQRLYATGVTGSTFDCTSNLFMDGTVAYASATALPSNAAAIQILTNSLIVSDGVTFEVAGDILIGSAKVIMNATTSPCKLKARTNNSPTNTVYYIRFGTSTNQLTTEIQLNGTSDTVECIIEGYLVERSVLGSNMGLMAFNATFGKFLNCDGTQVNKFAVGLNYTGATARQFTCNNLVFDNTTGLEILTGITATCGHTFQKLLFVNTIVRAVDGNTAVCMKATYSTTANGGVNRLWEDCSFDKTVIAAAGGRSPQYTRCIFNYGWTAPTSTGPVMTDCVDWYVESPDGLNTSPSVLFESAVVTNGLALVDAFTYGSSSEANFHFYAGPSGTVTGRVHDRMGEKGGTLGTAGDWYKNLKTAFTITHSLFLKSSGGGNGKVLMFGNTGLVMKIRHCLFYNFGAAIQFGEGATPQAGWVDECRDSIFYVADGDSHENPSTTSGGYAIDCADGAYAASPDNVVRAAGCINNVSVNGKTLGRAGSPIEYYDIKWSGTAPGANDLKVTGLANIGFTDSTRSVLSYWRSKGLTGTDAQVTIAGRLAWNMRFRPSAVGYNSNLVSLTEPVDYVKAGFVPTGAILNPAVNPASDGTSTRGPLAWGGVSTGKVKRVSFKGGFREFVGGVSG